MKFISLVFDYDFGKQKKSGRIWADRAYRSKDFIFEYTAASIVTFCHHNPDKKYIIDTDDVDLLTLKIKLVGIRAMSYAFFSKYPERYKKKYFKVIYSA